MPKLIVQNTTNRVKYILSDNQAVTQRPNGTWRVSKPGSSDPKFGIADMGVSNSQVIENVTNVPDGAIGNQYDYVDGTWTEREDWAEIVERREARRLQGSSYRETINGIET